MILSRLVSYGLFSGFKFDHLESSKSRSKISYPTEPSRIYEDVLYDVEVVDTCLKLFTEKGFEFESTERPAPPGAIHGFDRKSIDSGS